MKHPRKTRLELLANRQGLSLAARLNPAASDLPHEVTERLRAARERALASRKVQTARAQASYSMGETLVLSRGDDERMGWLGRLSSGLALLVLVVGSPAPGGKAIVKVAAVFAVTRKFWLL